MGLAGAGGIEPGRRTALGRVPIGWADGAGCDLLQTPDVTPPEGGVPGRGQISD